MDKHENRTAQIQADVDSMPDDPKQLKQSLFRAWLNNESNQREWGETRQRLLTAEQRAHDAEAALRALLRIVKVD